MIPSTVTPPTMTALVQDGYGSSDVLRVDRISTPAVADGDVLIRVHAASLHQGDWHLMTGLPYLTRILGFGFRAPKRRVRGSDVAGTIEAVGANVTELKPGDEVFGVCHGAVAEFATARAEMVVPKPANVTFEQAAAVPTSAVTALQGLRASGLAAGQSILVIGAGGGVGIFAVQLAASLGAEITGVCSGAKAELVRSLGADHVIDYTRDDFATQDRRYDVILDTAGNRPLRVLRRALAPKGTLVLVGGENGGRLVAGFDRQLRALALSPFVSQRLTGLAAVVRREDLIRLSELLAAGSIVPVIDRAYPLADAVAAFRLLESGKAQGKIVIAG